MSSEKQFSSEKAGSSVWVTGNGAENALDFGFVNDGTGDNRVAFNNFFASKKHLFCPRGIYNFADFVELSAHENIRILGEPGTIFTTPKNKIITLSGTLFNIEFQDIAFQSTKNSATEDTEGLIFGAFYGANNIGRNIRFRGCQFQTPNTHVNALKFVSEGTNSLLENLLVDNCHFKDVGRFIFEVNDNLHDSTIRVRNVSYTNNISVRTGKYQYGGVSLFSVGGQITGNVIIDLLGMDGSPANAQRIAFEFGGDGFICNNNSVRSENNFFIGMLINGKNHQISDNILSLKGGNNNQFVRGINLVDADDVHLTDNHIDTDGDPLRFQNSSDCTIANNTFRTRSVNVLYFFDGSKNNRIYDNTLNNVDAPGQNGMILFIDSTTTGNRAWKNRFRPHSDGMFPFVQLNGAYDNTASPDGEYRIVTDVNNYILAPSDDVIFLNPTANATLYLGNPIAYVGNAGRRFRLKNLSTFTITLTGNSMGAGDNFTIGSRASKNIISDGTSWRTI